MHIELDFEKRYRLVREVIETVVLTVLMFLVIRLAVQNFNIEGMSMEPSLHDQELILVDKWSYLFHAPARGDVIVFVAPPEPSTGLHQAHRCSTRRYDHHSQYHGDCRWCDVEREVCRSGTSGQPLCL